MASIGHGLVKRLIELNIDFFNPHPLLCEVGSQFTGMGQEYLPGGYLFGDNAHPDRLAGMIDLHLKPSQVRGLQLKLELIHSVLMGSDNLTAHLIQHIGRQGSGLCSGFRPE